MICSEERVKFPTKLDSGLYPGDIHAIAFSKAESGTATVFIFLILEAVNDGLELECQGRRSSLKMLNGRDEAAVTQ